MMSETCNHPNHPPDRIISLDALLNLPRILGKTVYVLGAGFSYPLGLPLISDFIPKGLDLLKQPCEEEENLQSQHQEIIREVMAITNRFRRPLATLPGRDPNLEDVFSFVDLLWENNGKDHDTLAQFVQKVCRHAFRLHLDARKKSSAAAQGTFVPRAHFNPEKVKMPAPEAGRAGVCMYYAFLSQVLGGLPQALPPTFADPTNDQGGYASSAVISLNYDLVIEEKLRALTSVTGQNPKAFYGFDCVASEQPWDRSIVHLPLLKLHGSINWRACSNSPCKQVNACEVTESWPGSETPLVYPSWLRDRREGSVFERVLTEARIHLRLAHRIVFIGYSLPPSDRHIAYLLADGLDTAEPPEIVTANLWQTKDEARAKVKKMMGERAARHLSENYPRGLKDLVQAWKHPSSVLNSP